MEEKEKEKNNEKEEKGSNSCVMDLSIDAEADDKENIEGNGILNKSFDDIKNFSKKLTLKDNFENIFDDIFLNEDEEVNEKLRKRAITVVTKKYKWWFNAKNKIRLKYLRIYLFALVNYLLNILFVFISDNNIYFILISSHLYRIIYVILNIE